MSEPAGKRATYEDLYLIPQNMTGEIINGELTVTPRPSRRHTSAVSSLGYKIGPSYQFGEGSGPGGWIIIIEPEIGLGEDILVPDLAGWKKERFLSMPSLKCIMPGFLTLSKELSINQIPIAGIHPILRKHFSHAFQYIRSPVLPLCSWRHRFRCPVRKRLCICRFYSIDISR